MKRLIVWLVGGLALCLANARPIVLAQLATEGLSGTSWRLVQFQGGDGEILRPEDGADYTVEFRRDDTVVVRLDCNRGRGTWVSRSPSQLELGPLGLTRAMCAGTRLHDQVAKQWSFIRSYTIRDTHLFLSLMADGGTYEFEPARTAAAPATTASAPSNTGSWLDVPTPASWNTAGAAVPRAPQVDGTVDPRCQTLARAPELEADKRLRDLGWDLVGAYQGGWDILVIRGAAGYDGMCRPRSYQDFVFLRGVFAGTLSPRTMDSRTDGALSRVTLQDGRQLLAEYVRYPPKDALCCASRTTTVLFEFAGNAPVISPVSASTTRNP